MVSKEIRDDEPFISIRNFYELFEFFKPIVINDKSSNEFSNNVFWSNNPQYADHYKIELKKWVENLSFNLEKANEKNKNETAKVIANQIFINMINTLASGRYFSPKSKIGIEISGLLNLKKTEQFIQGYFFNYFENIHKNNFYISQWTVEQISGYFSADARKLIINSNPINHDVKKIIKENEGLVLGIQSTRDELEAKVIKANEISEKLDELWKEKTENLELSFKKTGEKLTQNYEAKIQSILIAGPVNHWYEVLSEYNGNRYKKTEEKTGIYVREKIKDKPWFYTKKSKNKKWIFKGKTKTYLMWSVIWAIIGIVGIVCAIWFSANNINFKDDWKTGTIFSVMSSIAFFIYGYILRILIKNWNVSRHIEEETNDRISLTIFYLSLINDNTIDSKDRTVALQEIFKRINTGLIKEPTPLGLNVFERAIK